MLILTSTHVCTHMCTQMINNNTKCGWQIPFPCTSFSESPELVLQQHLPPHLMHSLLAQALR